MLPDAYYHLVDQAVRSRRWSENTHGWLCAVERADLWQDGALGLVEACEKWKPGRAPFGPYAMMMIQHRLDDGLRRMGLPRTYQGMIGQRHDRLLKRIEIDENYPDPHPSPDRELEVQEMAEWLRVRLTRLPRRMRVVMCYYYGLCNRAPSTLEQIGVKLKVSRERVRQIRFQAMERLREAVVA